MAYFLRDFVTFLLEIHYGVRNSYLDVFHVALEIPRVQLLIQKFDESFCNKFKNFLTEI